MGLYINKQGRELPHLEVRRLPEAAFSEPIGSGSVFLHTKVEQLKELINKLETVSLGQEITSGCPET